MSSEEPQRGKTHKKDQKEGTRETGMLGHLQEAVAGPQGQLFRSSTAQATHLVDIMDEDRDTRCHVGWQQPCVPWPGDK